MRLAPVILAGALSAAMAGALDSLTPRALAQVTTDTSALDALRKPSPPAHRRAVPHRRAPVRRPSEAAPESGKTESGHTESGKTESGKTEAAAPERAKPPEASVARPAQPAKPVVPAVPPAIAALPPPIVVPTAHPPPLPTVPVANDAPGTAAAIPGGVRITFGEGRAELNPATEAVIRDFAESHRAQPDQPITVYAYAAGSKEDPSTPRRLSLERALAARAVLMRAGIPSPRIYPRALGSTGGGEDPDRVDVVAVAPAAAEPAAAQARP